MKNNVNKRGNNATRVEDSPARAAIERPTTLATPLARGLVLGLILSLSFLCRPAIVSGQVERFRLGDPRSPGTRDPAPPATQRPHPAVVRVIVPEGSSYSLGSGTLVELTTTAGLIVTNWHVVHAATGTITVVFADGARVPATLLKTDRDWDLAALAVPRPNITPVTISRRAPQPGEWLMIAGYGAGDYRAAYGRCTQYMSPGANFPTEIVELSAAARQGDSGGPIFNERLELAGVLFGEAQGLTSGSYCLRVAQFLAGLQPTAPPAWQPPANVAVNPGPTNGTPAATSAPGVPTGPAASAAAPMVDPFQALSPAAAPTVAAASPLTNPTPPTLPAATTSAAAPSPPTPSAFAILDSQPRDPTPEASPPGQLSLPFDWRVWVGTSTIEQTKAGFALVGLLTLIVRGLRWLITA